MGVADDFVRAPMAGAVHIRVVKRRRKRKVSPLGWVADEIFGSDSQPSDQPPPLEVSCFDWVDAAGRTGSIPVADADVGDDDLAVLLRYGRRYGLGVSVWSESPALDRAMRLDHQWFPTPAVDEPHPDVAIERNGDRVDVETIRRSTTFDKVVGRLRRDPDAGGEVWRAVLDPIELRIVHQHGERWERSWPRTELVAIGPGLRGGTRVVTVDVCDDIPRISQRGRVGDATRRMDTIVAELSTSLDSPP